MCRRKMFETGTRKVWGLMHWAKSDYSASTVAMLMDHQCKVCACARLLHWIVHWDGIESFRLDSGHGHRAAYAPQFIWHHPASSISPSVHLA